MAVGEGMRRLERGITRTLTKTEMERGSVYLTRDRMLPDVLNTEDFAVVIDGETMGHRRVDKFGRFQVPRSTLRRIGGERLLTIKVRDRTTIDISAIEG